MPLMRLPPDMVPIQRPGPVLAGVEAARLALHRSGAPAAVERLIEDLADTALGALEAAPVRDVSARKALGDLVRSATQRAV